MLMLKLCVGTYKQKASPKCFSAEKVEIKILANRRLSKLCFKQLGLEPWQNKIGILVL